MKAHTDKLMLVKLNLFRDTASMLNGFLIKFQSDSPFVPFLSDWLEDLMRSMMKKLLIREVINKANTTFLLLKVDVSTNQLPVSKIQLPTASAEVLSMGSFKQHLQDGIKKKYTLMLRSIILKLQERSPLKYKLVRSASSLSPVNMMNEPESSRSKFDKLINTFIRKSVLHRSKLIMQKNSMTSFLTLWSYKMLQSSRTLT